MEAPERILAYKNTGDGYGHVPYVRADLLTAALARAEAAEAALEEIEAVVGCLEGKDALDRELIRNIKASLALIEKDAK